MLPSNPTRYQFLMASNKSYISCQVGSAVPQPSTSENRQSSVPINRPFCWRLSITYGLCCLSSAFAYAQDSEQGPGPTLVRGAFTLESSLGIEALNDSNIFQSATNVQSSPIWKLAPSLLMEFEPARSRLEFGYDGDYAWYDNPVTTTTPTIIGGRRISAAG